MRFAITGTSGFIGRHLVATAIAAGHEVHRLQRDGSTGVPRECDAVIHLAGRAHVLHETATDPLREFRDANVGTSIALAHAAIAAGVPKLIFVSSIGVAGNRSQGTPLTPDAVPEPGEPYAVSKLEAERALADLLIGTATRAVIIRPPLVHGPEAKGNFRRLLHSIVSRHPLPVASIMNRRSFIGVENLCQGLLSACVPEGPSRDAADPSVNTRTYHIADDGVISTRRLVEVLAEGMGVRPRLLPVPRWLAVGGATLLGKGAMARRLFDDLEVDDSDFRRDFAWRPRVGLEDGLRAMAADFAARQGRPST